MTRFAHPLFKLAIAAVGFAVRPDATTAPERSPHFRAGRGAPAGVCPRASIYLRMDGQGWANLIYVSDGAGWKPLPLESVKAAAAPAPAPAKPSAEAVDAAADLATLRRTILAAKEERTARARLDALVDWAESSA